MVNLRLQQEDFDTESSGRNERTMENRGDFDLSALFFRRGDFPLTVYSKREQTLYNRQFGGTLDSIRTDYGAKLQIRSETLPNQFHYFHRQQDESGSGDFNASDYSLTQDTFAWNGRIKPMGGHNFWWDYTFDSIRQSGVTRPSNNFDRTTASATHTYDFGENKDSQIRSALFLYSETGDNPIDRFRWDEKIRLIHSRSFETIYDYTYDFQKRAQSTQRSHNASATFIHELFDSLITTGQAGFNLLDLPDDGFDSMEYFGNLTAEYNKIVPYGDIQATALTNFSRRDESARGSPLDIVDEPHNFGASGLITLSRQNIEPASIVITNLSGIILYAPGLDYTVQAFPDRIEIRRVLGGNIAPGQSVLIDYQIGADPASVTDTFAYGVTFRYNFTEGWLKGASPYIRYTDQNQDRMTDGPSAIIANDFTDLTFGLNYRFDRILLIAEHQIHDSSLSPFDTSRIEARFTERFDRDNSLILSAFYQDTSRPDENINTAVTSVTGRWDTRLSERLRLTVTGIWRQEEDSAGIDSQAFEQLLDLNWRRHQTTIFVSARNTIRESDADDTQFQSIQIGIRRNF